MTEKISSLVDGELAGDELAAACKSLEHEGLRTVERYQLIGALMRGECAEASVRACRDDLATRISERIAAEPHRLVRAAPRRRRAVSQRHATAFVGGFAAAAAIAAVAVMVITPGWFAAPGAAPTPLAAAGDAQPPAEQPMDMDELNSLLVEHGEFTGSAGLNGLLAYAKFVSHSSE